MQVLMQVRLPVELAVELKAVLEALVEAHARDVRGFPGRADELNERSKALTVQNVLRAAVELGLEEMSESSADRIFKALTRNAVVRGRPRAK